MKLTVKWSIWFIGIGIYVMTLGGVFYYNLFKWTFDEKLKADIIDTIKVHAPVLREGLFKNPKTITMEEFSLLSDTLSKDERIASIVYLNKNGTIRWHREPRFIGIGWDEYISQVGAFTDAINQAVTSKTPKVRPVPKQPYYEIAIPLTANNELIGSILLLISRATSEALVKSAMAKYIVGAIGVLVLLGIPFYWFFYHYVITPLESLSEAIEVASFKTFELRFEPRNDEIGLVADSVNVLLKKFKKEIEEYEKRDKYYREIEEKWWKTILKTIVPLNEYVIVVDENNNVLYANFELNAVEGEQIHLLDVVDAAQQNLLRLVGQAFDNPGEIIEGETIFKGQNLGVKVVYVGTTSELNRTLILFYPKKVY
jgi:hypothetical protein